MPAFVGKRRAILAAAAVRSPPSFSPLDLFPLGTEGEWHDPATISSLFQDAAGTTPVTAANDPVGLARSVERWGGQTFLEVMAAQPQLVTNGDFTNGTTGWTPDDATLSVVGGKLRITTGVNFGRAQQAISVTAGKSYLVSAITAAVSGSNQTAISFTSGIDGGGSAVAGFRPEASAPATLSGIFTAPATATIYLSLSNFFSGAAVNDFGSVSVKEIPSVPATQSTSGFRGSYQTSPRPLLRFDGGDDRLMTTRNPTLAGCLIFVGTPDGASDSFMGSAAASDGRCYIGTDASGYLCGGIGADSPTTIVGSSDVRGTAGVYWLKWTGSAVALGLNNTTVYSAAQNGAVNTTVPITLAARNANGTPTAFADVDALGFFALNYAPTDAQIAQLVSYYGF